MRHARRQRPAAQVPDQKRITLLHPIPYTLHPKPKQTFFIETYNTPSPNPPTPYTPNPVQTLHPTPVTHTLHPTPYTIHPTPYTLHPP